MESETGSATIKTGLFLVLLVGCIFSACSLFYHLIQSTPKEMQQAINTLPNRPYQIVEKDRAPHPSHWYREGGHTDYFELWCIIAKDRDGVLIPMLVGAKHPQQVGIGFTEPVWSAMIVAENPRDAFERVGCRYDES